MKTVLITGCSSGFGLETARYFLERGWKVIATMRKLQDDLLPASEHLRLLALDVTDADSIRNLIETAGPIDVLVNNAGIGLFSAVEGVSMNSVRAVFETNTFGTIAMTQAVIPQFRQRRAGVVINVTSSVTLISIPLLAVYTGSKAAVNAFTESLALELAPFNVRACLVLPGRAPTTRFGENARALSQAGFPEPYAKMAEELLARFEDDTSDSTQAHDVAEAVWRAANEPSIPIKTAAGADALALMPH